MPFLKTAGGIDRRETGFLAKPILGEAVLFSVYDSREPRTQQAENRETPRGDGQFACCFS
jgi:hypothetical protein